MTIAKSIRATHNGILLLLNSSGLPIDVMDLLIRDLSKDIHKQAEEEYEKECLAAGQTEEGGEENGTLESDIHGSPDRDHSAESE